MKAQLTSAGFFAALLAAPAAASSDGTLGPTSTGSFNVSATISPSPVDEVQVFGLDDFSFAGTEGQSSIDSQTKSFCVIRETGGTVGLTISSFDAADTYFRVKTPGGADEIQMLFTFHHTGTPSGVTLTEGTEELFPAEATCTDGVTPIALAISLLNTGSAAAGNYSNSFLVTVAPK